MIFLISCPVFAGNGVTDNFTDVNGDDDDDDNGSDKCIRAYIF